MVWRLSCGLNFLVTQIPLFHEIHVCNVLWVALNVSLPFEYYHSMAVFQFNMKLSHCLKISGWQSIFIHKLIGHWGVGTWKYIYLLCPFSGTRLKTYKYFFWHELKTWYSMEYMIYTHISTSPMLSTWYQTTTWCLLNNLWWWRAENQIKETTNRRICCENQSLEKTFSRRNGTCESSWSLWVYWFLWC